MTAVPAAMSAALRAAVGGQHAPLRVVGSFPEAVYLKPLESCGLPLLSIVTAGAVIHPHAAVLPRGQRLPSFVVGEVAQAGGGRLSVGEAFAATSDAARPGTGRRCLTVAPSRWWNPSPVVVPVTAGVVREMAAYLSSRLFASVPLQTESMQRVHAFVSALRHGAVAAALDAGRAMLGRGPGLTPAGDDVLSGVFVASVVLGRALRGSSPHVPVLDAEVADRLVAMAADTTTIVSHALLWHAARGHAAGPVAAMLRALAGQHSIERCLPDLLAIGGTSGPHLASGLAAGAWLAAALAAPHEAARDVGTGREWPSTAGTGLALAGGPRP